MSESPIGSAEGKVAPAADPNSTEPAPAIASPFQAEGQSFPLRVGIRALIARPLTVGFLATLGVLGALIVGIALGSITTLLLQLALALFIALGLDPIVQALQRRGMNRGSSST